jgi:hypothetical protein
LRRKINVVRATARIATRAMAAISSVVLMTSRRRRTAGPAGRSRGWCSCGSPCGCLE